MIQKHVQTIKELRIKRGISQLELAKVLGMSRPSYIALEQGKRAITDLTLTQLDKLSGALGTSRSEIESGEAPDYEKYKQMILTLLKLNKKIPKTKLAKLLYLADFSWYYTHLESMSGMQYRKIKYGPVADSYFRIIDEMYDKGEISITQTSDGAMLISQTRSGEKADVSSVSADEKMLLERIDKKWKGKKTSDIVDFTHKQMPFMFAEENDIVSYDLFTQENPDEIY